MRRVEPVRLWSGHCTVQLSIASSPLGKDLQNRKDLERAPLLLETGRRHSTISCDFGNLDDPQVLTLIWMVPEVCSITMRDQLTTDVKQAAWPVGSGGLEA